MEMVGLAYLSEMAWHGNTFIRHTTVMGEILCRTTPPAIRDKNATSL